MLNFTEEEWKKTLKYHNLVNYKNIFKLQNNPILGYNAKVTIDGITLSNSDFDVINQIHKIIENYDVGNYEYGGVTVSIINKLPLNNTICENPKFDMDLLKIS